ncbi:ABC transporter ATP-binding protein [Nakamurella endophytica]|uniref:Multidrug ABC transporter ATP-binding protein n=1 Tax=Nakamurella endophytica TaxID=1748367 RepID=A0A917SMB4_9ACTN|nr:ABC transporter ATP-binding protein [Nakamurella endophytica]GGL89736.1 multidrug ABC transporter ATP-binding protein [Nakamurella endophytica]
MDAIEVDAVVVRRDRHGPPALDGITARVAAGRVTGLLGPSGAGKTTLLRVVVGVQRWSAGSVRVLGLPAGSPALRSRIGYLTQAAAVYADLTVAENVRYFAALAGAAPGAVVEVLDEVGMARWADRLAGALSGGQRARVSLACALVGRPDLLVLDEPTVGQDPVLRDELWRSFRARAAAGATVLVSSHVMDEAARCDDLLLVRDGRVLASGTPGSVMAQAGETDMDSAFLTLIRRQQQRTPVGATSGSTS